MQGSPLFRLSICASVCAAICAVAPAARADAVAAIEILGNDRTARGVILDAASVDDHASLDRESLDDIRQRVMNLKLFETVDVSVRGADDARVLTIRVKERWTLLPIPFASSSSRGTQGGVFLLDTNLFGHNKLAAIGGTYATWGGSAFAIYQDPAVAGSRATLRALVSYSKTLRERRLDDEVMFAVDDTRTTASLLAGYRVTRALSVSAGWFALRARDEPRPGYDAMPVTGTLHGPSLTAEYRGTDFKMYYDDGLSCLVQIRQASRALGADRDALDASLRLQYTRALVGDQSTSVTVQGILVDGDRIADARLLGGTPGSRGFEFQSLWVDHAATVTVEHQIPFFARRWGIWTANVFIDAGRASLGGTHDTFATPGTGLRLYLPRMNFPAVGFDLAYSPTFDRWFASGSVGFAM